MGASSFTINSPSVGEVRSKSRDLASSSMFIVDRSSCITTFVFHPALCPQLLCLDIVMHDLAKPYEFPKPPHTHTRNFSYGLTVIPNLSDPHDFPIGKLPLFISSHKLEQLHIIPVTLPFCNSGIYSDRPFASTSRTLLSQCGTPTLPLRVQNSHKL
ncbi:hypothetical protein BGZ60DRAFT_35659 [Tricladium varicosporioides]|nr:hypothetical protein BGZ60DRAFT_35659 [Hymenoscyphus varicosporioides]